MPLTLDKLIVVGLQRCSLLGHDVVDYTYFSSSSGPFPAHTARVLSTLVSDSMITLQFEAKVLLQITLARFNQFVNWLICAKMQAVDMDSFSTPTLSFTSFKIPPFSLFPRQLANKLSRTLPPHFYDFRNHTYVTIMRHRFSKSAITSIKWHL